MREKTIKSTEITHPQSNILASHWLNLTELNGVMAKNIH